MCRVVVLCQAQAIVQLPVVAVAVAEEGRALSNRRRRAGRARCPRVDQPPERAQRRPVKRRELHVQAPQEAQCVFRRRRGGSRVVAHVVVLPVDAVRCFRRQELVAGRFTATEAQVALSASACFWKWDECSSGRRTTPSYAQA